MLRQTTIGPQSLLGNAFPWKALFPLALKRNWMLMTYGIILFACSNTGFLLLASIVEKISPRYKISFSTYAQKGQYKITLVISSWSQPPPPLVSARPFAWDCLAVVWVCCWRSLWPEIVPFCPASFRFLVGYRPELVATVLPMKYNEWLIIKHNDKKFSVFVNITMHYIFSETASFTKSI